MSGQVSRGSAGEYQADEQAEVARLRWRARALEHRLSSCGMWLSCSVACGTFPDQGLNLCVLCWQADSSPLKEKPVNLDFSIRCYEKT